MAGRGGKAGRAAQDRGDVVDLLLEMEPELRLLEGVVATLRILSETADQVDPVALAMLACTGGEALDELTATWNGLRETARACGAGRAELS